jgi:acyl-coenzyme A thioesterase PaaI-like protein
MAEVSLQDMYAPNSVCFGCGPANPEGLHVKSRVEGKEVVADWKPLPHHLAFEGYMNGGIIGVLFDCHSNWAAAHYIMKAKKLDKPPATVTAGYCVTLLRPTPMDKVLRLESRLTSRRRNRVTVRTTLTAGGAVTATFKGTFVEVREGHPAFNRWK